MLSSFTAPPNHPQTHDWNLMPTPPDTYKDVMDQAEEALKLGVLPNAAAIYDIAAGMAATNTEEASALQMKSIALGMSGQPEAARLASDAALKLVRKDANATGRILRDAGMAVLHRASRETHAIQRDVLFSRAVRLFEESLEQLSKEPGNELEEAATIGFTGRYYLLKGERNVARRLMEGVDIALRAGYNRDYELNNLMWLVRAVPFTKRFGLVLRIVKLVKTTKQLRRYDELALIMVGGDRLYRFVDNRPWIQEVVRRVRRK